MIEATSATATTRKTPAVRYERRSSDTWREPSDRLHEGPKPLRPGFSPHEPADHGFRGTCLNSSCTLGARAGGVGGGGSAGAPHRRSVRLRRSSDRKDDAAKAAATARWGELEGGGSPSPL